LKDLPIAVLGLVLSVTVASADVIDDCSNALNSREAVVGCTAIIISDWATERQIALAFNNRANALGSLGQTELAIADYDRAIALDPHYATAYYNRGTAYLDTAGYDRAIRDFDRVIALEPTRADAYHNRGLALLRSGQFDDAIADLTGAIELDPGMESAYNNRGVAWQGRGRRDRALADFSAAIALDPKDVAARRNLEKLLANGDGPQSYQSVSTDASDEIKLMSSDNA
jgi:tetratricopeptide (TPR) repeat protein